MLKQKARQREEGHQGGQTKMAIGDTVDVRSEDTGELLWTCIGGASLPRVDEEMLCIVTGTRYKVERVIWRLRAPVIFADGMPYRDGHCDVYVSVIP